MENNLNKEIFCLQYELKTMSDIVFKNEAERWVNGFMHKTTEEEHLDRYKFILDKVRDKKVLDIACGSGYGSFLLAKEGNAEYVIGVDLDGEAIKYGEYKYPHENIKRIVADATKFSNTELFDAIVSFETIEHVPDYHLLLENFYHLLKKDGVLFISTPITKETTKTPNNPYHIIEWSFFDFQNLINTKYTIQEIYLQNVVLKNKEKYIVPSLPVRFYNKFIRTFFPKKYKAPYYPPEYIKGEKFEKFNGQYDMEDSIRGYQMIIAKKNES